MELYQALITLDGWTFLAQICNLMIQLFIFKKFLLNPVKNVIAERKAKADSQIADATKLRTEAEAMKQSTSRTCRMPAPSQRDRCQCAEDGHRPRRRDRGRGPRAGCCPQAEG